MKRNSGFSLVELIVVIALMATLVGVAVPMYSGYLEKAKETKDAEYLANLSKSAQLFAAEKGFELEAVWVAPVIQDNQGVEIVMKGNIRYTKDDISEFYAMLGGDYNFETMDNETPIYFTPVKEEEKPAGHDHETKIETNIFPPTCMEQGYSICDTCGKKYNPVDRAPHSLTDEEIGNLTVWRCSYCDYVYVDFKGNQIGGNS